MYRQAIDVYTLARGREGMELVNMLEAYAQVLRALGNKVKAAKMDTRAKAIRDSRTSTERALPTVG
jgi:hypothetical protein